MKCDAEDGPSSPEAEEVVFAARSGERIGMVSVVGRIICLCEDGSVFCSCPYLEGECGEKWCLCVPGWQRVDWVGLYHVHLAK